MTATPAQPSPTILRSSAGRGWRGVEADLLGVARGIAHVPGAAFHSLGLHVGAPVTADCTCDGRRLRRMQAAGDFGFVPAGVDACWEDDADCRLLRLRLDPALVDGIAAGLGGAAARTMLVPRIGLRDARIEAIGWAVKADLEAAAPSAPLYVDHLASALAVRLIEIAGGDRARQPEPGGPKLSTRQSRLLMEYIEAELGRQLRLAELAAVAGLSVTRLKVLFRNSMGAPVHQYVIRRRAERARALLASTSLPASQVALAVGFAHQSHMIATLRRVLGVTPRGIDRPRRERRPNLREVG